MVLNQAMKRVASRRGMWLVRWKFSASWRATRPTSVCSMEESGDDGMVDLAGRGGDPGALLVPRARARLLLSSAKHASIQGHARWSKRLARLIPFYEYDEDRFFTCDDPPPEVAARDARRSRPWPGRSAMGSPHPGADQAAMPMISDLQFISRYRVPFQFSGMVRGAPLLRRFPRERRGGDGHQFRWERRL